MEESKATSIRIPLSLWKKISYIAQYNDRSTSKEIVQLIKKHVSTFEERYGKVEDD